MTEHKHTNRLAGETSPYLLQHRHNPVDWYPWSPEAFERARADDKPLLLSVGYSACHWCHVMERESFENEEIAALMNRLFVNIKVDREERPDVDQIYMQAVQSMTGHGGWPMTVFLTPEGVPFYGGTYFPPVDRHGIPAFPRLIQGVAEAYRGRRGEVVEAGKQLLEQLRQGERLRSSNTLLTDEILFAAYQALSGEFDDREGGMGRAPKFPQPMNWEFLLRFWKRTGNARALEMARLTLTKMARGGMYDQLGGGFHRYSVDGQWLVPHFEKMLYDNAQLTRTYAQAFYLTGDLSFKRVVEETVEYLLREMFHAEGGFYSTQDADSEGEEGKFFVWSEAEVMRIMGEEAGQIFCRIYDVSEPGNFEGRNILHPILGLDQAARYFRREPQEIDRLLAEAKRKLFEEREKRVKPFRDEKILTVWNGLMLTGLAEAIRILPERRYLEAAEKTVGFIFSRMVEDGFLLHTYKDGQAKLRGYLDDYAFLALGLLDLYEVTLERSLLKQAIGLSEKMIDEFWDDIDGGFFYTGRSHEKLISRTKPAFDSSIPSGNSSAIQLLLRLYHYTGREEYLKRAERCLRLYYDAMEKQPFGFTHMFSALDFYLAKPKEIVLVGERGDPELKDLVQKIHSLYLPNKTLQLLVPGEPMSLNSPLLEGKTQVNGRPTAYVCHNFTCSPPVTQWDDLKELLEP